MAFLGPARLRRSLTTPALALALVLSLPSHGLAAEEVIEKIEVRGLRKMTADAFLFASGLKVGQPYDPGELRKSFHRLWGRRLFSDLKVEVEPGAAGKVVIFTASERPVVVSIDYDQVKAATRANMEDRLKERNVEMAVGRPLDRRALHRAEDVIRDLLGEKGYLDARVKAQITVVSDFSAGVRFRIRQGPRTRIRKIEFVGNTVHKDRALKRAMKLTREHSWLSAIGGKNVYFPMKMDQDLEKVRELYLNDGYLDFEIRPPQVEVRAGRRRSAAKGVEPAPGEEAPEEVWPDEPPPPAPPEDETERQRKRREKREARARKEREKGDEKQRKWVFITVRVKEGPQYRLGEMKTAGNTVFTDREILDIFPRIGLKKGEILNRGLLDGGTELLRSMYGEKGYIYASVGRNVEKKEGHIADVTVEIREDRPYVVDRIEFEGNTTTHDEVLRREMKVTEGGLINRRRLDISTVKLNQLGFIVPIEEAIIEPVPGTDRARIRMRMEEKGRNEIQVGGGYAAREGFFFQGSYVSHNFLGRGQNLGIAMQVGGRTSRYSISLTEPWFLGKPVALGFSVFSRDLEFALDSTRSGAGGAILVSRRFADFWEVRGTWSYEDVRLTDRLRSPGGESFERETQTKIGLFSPAIKYDTVNNPFRPTRGREINLVAGIAGSYLAGDNSYYKPIIMATQYVPLTRRTFLGAHGEFGIVSAYGEGAATSDQILDIPRFERFFIGGDILGPRVFETRSISPVRFISRNGDIARRRSQIVRYRGRDVLGQRVEKFCDSEFDFTVEPSPTPGEPAGFHRCTGGLRQALVGGDRYYLAQFEYALNTAGPFILAGFLDLGNAVAEDDGWGFDTMRVSAGLEARIYLPVFQAPLRFIWGVPIREESFDQTNSFTFSIGSSF